MTRGNPQHRAILVACTLVFVGVIIQVTFARVPTIASPLPMPVLYPYFMGMPLLLVAAIPGGLFLAMFWPITRESPGPIPMRATVLLTIGTGLSALWFIFGWKYGLEYQDYEYVRAVATINTLLAAVLWGLWSAFRLHSTFARRAVFGLLLFYWLFSYAFPYLGELP